MRTTIQNLLATTAPSVLKKEYHGNGKSAWYGPDEYTTTVKGVKVKAVQTSRRYSYRWHKTVTKYFIDGDRYYHRGTFKAALRKVGVDV